MKRKNTILTLEFLVAYLQGNPGKWFSTNHLSRRVWVKARTGGWYPYSRVGRLLFELSEMRVIEKLAEGRQWWRSEEENPEGFPETN